MGFWIFMMVMDLLIPAVMIGLGKQFQKNPPKEINWVSGYRTSMSMKNRETWEFAHQYCGKLWHVWGMVLIPLTVIPMLAVIGQDKDTVGEIGGIVCFIQMIPLAGVIVPTEIALRKRFDRNGRRKI